MSTNPNQRNHSSVAAPPFVMSPAKFLGTSLYLGIVAPSAAGKTKSSLELARGIQVVTGGKIGILDTENGRALHYAKEYQFSLPDGADGLYHLPFSPPFSPARYQAAYDYMIKQGIKIIVTDSFSHEHEGTGGVLEMHDEDIEKGMRDPSAWTRGKGERRELVGHVLQAKGIHWIFCYRAKEKMRWIKGQPPEARGLMPIGNESFIFEQTCNFLLPAGANGVPVLASSYPDEELIIKVPGQYRHLFTEPRQLSAALGTHLAAWAVPSYQGRLPPLPSPMRRGQSSSVSPVSVPVSAPASTPVPSTPPTVTLAAVGGAVNGVAAANNAVSELVARYNSAETLDVVDDLDPVCKHLIKTVSAEDAGRLRDAANAALDRLDPPVKAMPDTVSDAAPAAPMLPAAPAPAPDATPRDLSMIEQLNANGLARFREALASYGETITQEQAGQLARDHLAAYAPEPKVGTEDGAMAQDEIMKRTSPPFASRASLGVMRRHLESCDAYPSYKSFCDDLALCGSAENVYECWRINGQAVDALPKEVCNDARLRASKKVEAVDSTILSGGPWLTARIKRGKTEAEAAAKTTSPQPQPQPQPQPASPPVPTVSDPSLQPLAPMVPVADVRVHAPMSSEIGQVLAVDLEKSATIEAVAETKTRIDRAIQQKKIPTSDAKTLFALHETKLAGFAVQASA